jgi:hypothetical protein
LLTSRENPHCIIYIYVCGWDARRKFENLFMKMLFICIRFYKFFDLITIYMVYMGGSMRVQPKRKVDFYCNDTFFFEFSQKWLICWFSMHDMSDLFKSNFFENFIKNKLLALIIDFWFDVYDNVGLRLLFFTNLSKVVEEFNLKQKCIFWKSW